MLMNVNVKHNVNEYCIDEYCTFDILLFLNI